MRLVTCQDLAVRLLTAAVRQIYNPLGAVRLNDLEEWAKRVVDATPVPAGHVPRVQIVASDAQNGAEILWFLVRYLFEHEDEPYSQELSNAFYVDFQSKFGLEVDCELTTLSQIIRCTRNPGLDLRV